MNAPEEPPKDETGQEKENPAAVTGKAEAQAAAVGEEPGNITVDALAEKIVANLFEKPYCRELFLIWQSLPQSNISREI